MPHRLESRFRGRAGKVRRDFGTVGFGGIGKTKS
jgi:hypothetical protein